LLAAGLALIGAGLAAVAPSGELIGTPLPVAGLTAIAVAALLYCVAELNLIHAEFRRQAYSFTLSGIPLVLSLLLLPGRDAVLARLAGAAVAFAIQRPSLLKGAYNLGAYVFEAALDLTLLHVLLGGHPPVTVTTGLTALGVVAGSDCLMTALVLLVIGFHQGRMSGRDARQVLLPALVFAIGCASMGLGAVLLLREGLLGFILLIAVGGFLIAGYRGYRVLHRRHEALTLMHDFVTDNATVTGFHDLASRLVGRARELMRASCAELILLDEADDGAVYALVVDEQNEVRPSSRTNVDWLLARVQETGVSALMPRNTRDAATKSWLRQRSANDGLVVPIPSTAGEMPAGLLVMTDRLGDTSTFTEEDLRLLQTIAAHLSVALRNTKLIERLRHDAHHDALTGLANRAYFNEQLSAALARQSGPGTAVLLLDLDRFKEVNDTLGHHVGDQLLVVLGQRLSQQLPPGTLIARLGGDEFAILLEGLTEPGTEALGVARWVAAMLGHPVALSEATLTCHVSVGVGLNDRGLPAADLLRHADTAMYAAKNTAVGAVVYSSELDQGRAERLALLADLHLALERHELTLRYQPKLDLATGQISGAEALVRWQHPHLGTLSPDKFIPLAESTGLIEALTEEVLRQALSDCRSWRELGLDLTVAVNISGRSISDPTLPERIAEALAEADVPADRLVLEITEGSALAEASVTIPILGRLAELGVVLSLDDFGTGYSSLAYLHRLPVREVKIDKSFVQGLLDPASEAASEALIASTISIAKTLKLRTVAEGIEDAATMTRLKAMGCDIAQGYLIGKPGSTDELLSRARPHIPAQGKRVILLAE
jgi:diguanylate cyclase (GGDEF)-like protein